MSATKLTTEQLSAATRVTNKLRAIAKSKGIEADDLHQEALIGVWTADGKFDPSKNVPYGAWLYQYSYLLCLTYINENGGPVKASAKTNRKYNFTRQQLNELTLVSRENLENDYWVKEVIDKLPEDKQQWLSELMGGMTQKQAAIEANTTVTTTQKWRNHIKQFVV